MPKRRLSPAELFGEYLGTRAVEDQRVEQLFRRLYDRVTEGPPGGAGHA